MDIEIFGKKFSMAYTVAAQSEIAKKFGGIEKLEAALNADDAAEMMENMVFCASEMIKGAADRERVRCKVMGCAAPEIDEITYDEMTQAICAADVSKIMETIIATMKEGNTVTVEVALEKGKNAKATQSK